MTLGVEEMRGRGRDRIVFSLQNFIKFIVISVLCQVDGLQKMLSGPDALVAAGMEPFIDMSTGYRPSRRNMRTRMGTNMGSRLSMQSRLQSRRERLSKTSELASFHFFL